MSSSGKSIEQIIQEAREISSEFKEAKTQDDKIWAFKKLVKVTVELVAKLSSLKESGPSATISNYENSMKEVLKEVNDEMVSSNRYEGIDLGSAILPFEAAKLIIKNSRFEETIKVLSKEGQRLNDLENSQKKDKEKAEVEFETAQAIRAAHAEEERKYRSFDIDGVDAWNSIFGSDSFFAKQWTDITLLHREDGTYVALINYIGSTYSLNGSVCCECTYDKNSGQLVITNNSYTPTESEYRKLFSPKIIDDIDKYTEEKRKYSDLKAAKVSETSKGLGNAIDIKNIKSQIEKKNEQKNLSDSSNNLTLQ